MNKLESIEKISDLISKEDQEEVTKNIREMAACRARVLQDICGMVING